jgi:hypothetical protein
MAEPRPAVRVFRVPAPPPAPPPVDDSAARLLNPERDDAIQVWDEGDAAHALPSVTPAQPFRMDPKDPKPQPPVPPLRPPGSRTPEEEEEEEERQREYERQLMLYKLRKQEAEQKHHAEEQARQHEEERQRELRWVFNTARIHADVTFQFVVLVSGHMGLATSTEQYWDGIGRGAEAVERAFENLITEQDQPEPMTSLPGASTLLAEQFLKTPIDVDDAKITEIHLRKATVPGADLDPLAEVQDLTQYAKSLNELYTAAGIEPKEVKNLPAAQALRTRLQGHVPQVANTGRVVKERLDAGYYTATEMALFDGIPLAAVERMVAVANKIDADRARAATPVDTAAVADAATKSHHNKYGKSLRVDGQIVNHVENGKLVLLRLMFQKGGFNQMQFRAWDMM